MKVSKIIATAALLSMAVVVSACNKGGGGGGGGGTSQGGVNPSYNFDFWTGFGNDYSKQINAVVKSYNDSHPDVHIEHTPKGDYDNLVTQVLGSVSTSTFPNIACGYPDHFAEYWKKGILNPLDDYISRYNREHNCDLISDYYPDYMKENMEIAYDDDGNAYTVGLPYNKSTEVLLVNGYYFDYFHSIDERIVVPTTWAELETITPYITKVVEDANLLDADSKYLIGKVNPNNDTAYDFRISKTDNCTGDEQVLQEIGQLTQEKQFFVLGYDSADNAFITILHQWGIPYTSYSKVDFDRDQYGKALFWQDDNKEATKNALKFFQDLNANHGFGVPKTFGEDLFCTAALEQGRCLFTIGSSGGLNKPQFEGKRLDIKPMIYRDTEHKEVISQGTSLGLLNKFKDLNNYDEEMYQAFCAMVELTTGSLQAEWVTTTGYFPSSKSAYNDPTYQELLNDDEPSRLMKLYRDAGKVNSEVYDATGANKWNKFVDPGFVGSNSIRVAVKNVIHTMTSGKNPGMDEIVAAVDAAWAKIDGKVK